MVLKKIGYKKPVRKVAPKRRFVVGGAGVSLSTSRLKNPCFAGLTEQQESEAKAADEMGNLDLLKLRCKNCGQNIGAKIMADYKLPLNAERCYEADPYPHERPKAQRPPARKPSPRK